MNRRLGALALPAVLTACSTPAPPPAPATPKLRDLATVDACTLLVESDFAKPFTKAPEPLNEPMSCRWSIERQQVWASVENESLDRAKVRVLVVTAEITPRTRDVGTLSRTRSEIVVQRLFT